MSCTPSLCRHFQPTILHKGRGGSISGCEPWGCHFHRLMGCLPALSVMEVSTSKPHTHLIQSIVYCCPTYRIALHRGYFINSFYSDILVVLGTLLINKYIFKSYDCLTVMCNTLHMNLQICAYFYFSYLGKSQIMSNSSKSPWGTNCEIDFDD